MSYDYLGLVNDVNGMVNETPLTTSNFALSVGFYSTVKEAINSAIRELNQQAYHWPHNHVTYNETLTAGTSRYAFQADAKVIDFGTFRVQEDAALGNATHLLSHIDYDDYLSRYIDSEYTSDTTDRTVPRFVTQAPNLEYVLYPSPDKAYTLSYEYFKLPVDLTAHGDIPSLPVAFRHIIVDGAMVHVYNFRGDTETADRINARFINGIENMRKIYINSDYNYMRDTRITRRSSYGTKTGEL
jgi:hypothetical protein